MTTSTPTRRSREAARLNDLLGQRPLASSRIFKAIATERAARIPISKIRPNPQQPRHTFPRETIDELAETIRLHGVQMPIIVEQPDEGTDDYVLVMGERRLRACSLLAARPQTRDFDPADFQTIPSVIRGVRSDLPDVDRLVKALIENLCREDLSVEDSAAAFRQLKDLTGWSWDRIASHLGLQVDRVRRLASLDGRDEILAPLGQGAITQPQAFALARLTRDVAEQLAPHVGGLSEPETARVVRGARSVGEERAAQDAAREGLATVGRAKLAPRSAVSHQSVPISTAGALVGVADIEWVDLSATPLWRLRRLTRVQRDDLATLIQATCEQLQIWPERSGA